MKIFLISFFLISSQMLLADDRLIVSCDIEGSTSNPQFQSGEFFEIAITQDTDTKGYSATFIEECSASVCGNDEFASNTYTYTDLKRKRRKSRRRLRKLVFSSEEFFLKVNLNRSKSYNKCFYRAVAKRFLGDAELLNLPNETLFLNPKFNGCTVRKQNKACID